MNENCYYDTILRYELQALCKEPLHIGAASGELGEVLIHPVYQIPFIQATSLAGVFRAAWNEKTREKCMGSTDNHRQSKVVFSDGWFDKESIALEQRPRLSMNAETGTGSGQKFEMSYIPAGAEFSFHVDILCKQEEKEIFEKEMTRILGLMHQGHIQLGGQKTNGCGYISFQQINVQEYSMKIAEDRKAWAEHLPSNTKNLLELIQSTDVQGCRYRIVLDGSTESSVLVKSIGAEGFGKDAADAYNIKSKRDGKMSYILPGSSIKGVCKNQAEKVMQYIEDEWKPENIFQGICFYDAPLKNIQAKIQPRIRIDKFTGGVVNGGLFSSKPVCGDVQICVEIPAGEQTLKKCGLMALVFRDIAVHQVSFGSGENIGQGYLDVEKITFESPDGRKAVIAENASKLQDDTGLMMEFLQALKGEDSHE